MQKQQQDITATILKLGMKLKVFKSNWWKILEFPFRPLDEKNLVHETCAALQLYCFYLGVE